jgi:hypothetical protein
VACCQVVDQDVLDTDAEQFDCETCPFVEMQATLDRDNEEAWSVYGRLGSRFLVDFGLIPDTLRRLVDGWPSAEVVDLMERLSVIHDVINPPPPPAQD